jgi:hypothetical protein
MVAVIVAAALSYGVRRTRTGSGAVGLVVAWGPLVVIYILVALAARAAGHT